MEMTAGEWCKLLGGHLEGDASTLITHPAKIEDAGPGAISFIANARYEAFAYSTAASAIIIDRQMAIKGKIQPVIIRVDQPYLSFTRVLDHFNNPHHNLIGTEEPSFIHHTATIGTDVYLGAFCYIGRDARLGNNVKIFPHVYVGEGVSIDDNSVVYAGTKIYRGCSIGRHCIIHAGVVIGADGFGFAPKPDGSYYKVPQLGHVVIEDDVEIGSNSCIDRATLGATIIRQGVKIDNLVQLAHNVEVGAHTVIAAQAGISGSTKIGRHCQIGGQVGFVGHIEIADGSKINAQSGVSKSIHDKHRAWNGAPAIDYMSSLRAQSVFRNLPELEKRVRELERNSR